MKLFCTLNSSILKKTQFTDSAYYYCNELPVNNSTSQVSGQTQNFEEQNSRSPLAATRANSLASADSPTGSACLKTEPHPTNNEEFNLIG